MAFGISRPYRGKDNMLYYHNIEVVTIGKSKNVVNVTFASYAGQTREEVAALPPWETQKFSFKLSGFNFDTNFYRQIYAKARAWKRLRPNPAEGEDPYEYSIFKDAVDILEEGQEVF